MNNIIFKIITVFFVWRLFLFEISFFADNFLKYDPSFPYSQDLLAKFDLPRFIYSFANFDGVHYITIAQKGYIGTGLIQAFFPLYPYLTMFLDILIGNTLLTGLLISNVFTIIVAISLYYYVKDEKKELAWTAIIVMLLFPTSFFFASLYTESLFLSLVILTFYFAKKKYLYWTTLFIFLASITRIVGIFLLPAVILFYIFDNLSLSEIFSNKINLSKRFYEGIYNFKKNKFKIAFLCFGAFGLLSYMAFLKYEFNDPLYFFHVQSEFGGVREERIVLYPQVLYRSVKILLTTNTQNISYFNYTMEFLTATIGLALVILATYRRHIGIMFFCLAAFILPTLTGTFSSMPRYILVCFPIYIYIAEKMNNHKIYQIIWFFISLALLLISCTMFIQGYFIG